MPLQDANPTPSFGGFGLRSGSVAELADQLRTLPLELEGVDRVAAAAGSLCSYGVLASVPGSTRCGPRIVDSWWRTTGLQLAVQLPQNVGRGVQVPFVGAGGKTKSGEAPEYHGSSQGRPGSYPRPRGRGPIQEVRATGRRSGDGPQPPRLARGSGLPWPIMKPPIEKFAVRYTLAHSSKTTNYLTQLTQCYCPHHRSLHAPLSAISSKSTGVPELFVSIEKWGRYTGRSGPCRGMTTISLTKVSMKALRSVSFAVLQELAHVLGVGSDGLHVIQDLPALGENRPCLFRRSL